MKLSAQYNTSYYSSYSHIWADSPPLLSDKWNQVTSTCGKTKWKLLYFVESDYVDVCNEKRGDSFHDAVMEHGTAGIYVK